MRNKIFLIIMLLPGWAFCQVPGYLGKKVMLGGGVSYSPVFSGLFFAPSYHPTALTETNGFTYLTYKGKSKSIFLPPLTYSLHAKFVVSEHTMLHLGIEFQKIGLPVPDYQANFNGNYYDPFSNSRYNSIYTGSDTFAYARARYTRLSVGFSKSAATAPIGAFVGHDFILLSTDVDAVDKQNVVHSLGQTFDFGYCLSFGYRRVVYDALVIETSANFNMYARGIFSFAHDIDEISTVDDLKKYAVTYGYFNNIVQLKLSASYIF